MKIKDIKSMTDEELNAKLVSIKAELFNLRFQHATGQLENGKKITEVRKSIARVYTVLKERELGLN